MEHKVEEIRWGENQVQATQKGLTDYSTVGSKKFWVINGESH